MVKTQQVITKKEQIKKVACERIEGFYLSAKRNIFSMAQSFYELKKEDKKLYEDVKEELDQRGVIPNTTIKELALIAECRDGYLIQNQERLPMTRYVLYQLSQDLKNNEEYFNRFKSVIKQKSLVNFSKKEIYEQTDRDNFIMSDVVSKEREVNVIENEKSITINIPKKILTANEKRVMKDYKKIKEIMNYAEFQEHNSLEKYISGGDE